MDKEEHAPTVVLLHEDALMRSALGRLVRELVPYQLVAEAADPAALKRAFAVGPAPAAVLLSTESALADQCAILRWLMKQLPPPRAVLLGPEPPTTTLVRAFRAGAHGFCCTQKQLQRLRTVLDLVCAGALAFPACVEAYLRQLLPEPRDLPARAPTEQERELLILLAHPSGLTRTAIAKELQVSLSRVKQICATLCEVYGVQGRSGLVQLAIRLGLVAP